MVSLRSVEKSKFGLPSRCTKYMFRRRLFERLRERQLSGSQRTSDQAECPVLPIADIQPTGKALNSTAANGQKRPLRLENATGTLDWPRVPSQPESSESFHRSWVSICPCRSYPTTHYRIETKASLGRLVPCTRPSQCRHPRRSTVLIYIGGRDPQDW